MEVEAWIVNIEHVIHGVSLNMRDHHSDGRSVELLHVAQIGRQKRMYRRNVIVDGVVVVALVTKVTA
jgi:hypothetical protein